jgi:alpha-1,2-mannosyltransferase
MTDLPSRLHGCRNPWWLSGLVLLGALPVAVALAFVARGQVEAGLWTTNDLQVFQASGKAVWNGQDPYLFWLPHVELSLVYPPFAGLLFAPLSLLSLEALRIVWFTGIFLALQGVVWLATGWAGLRRTWIRLLLCPLIAAASIFFFHPVEQELWTGQVNMFLTILLVADLCRRDGARGKGIGVGLAAGIKLTPGLFIVYLVLTRRFREALTALITFAATVAAGFLVMPQQAWRYWTDYAWDADRVHPVPAIMFNQNLRAAIARLLPDSNLVLPWALTAAAVVVAGLAVCVGLHRRGMEREGVMLCGVTALLVSPITWIGHWVWLIPVLVVLVAGTVRTRSVVWATLTLLTAAVAVVHPYTWIGGYDALPSGLLQQVEASSLVLVGLMLLAGGVALWWSRRAWPPPEPALTAKRATA